MQLIVISKEKRQSVNSNYSDRVLAICEEHGLDSADILTYIANVPMGTHTIYVDVEKYLEGKNEEEHVQELRKADSPELNG